ncbi:CUB domain-containing protein, partial [Flavobacterium lacus]
MKRITLLLLLFLLTGTVTYSQVPQNFEGGIPPGWTRFNNAFGAAQWTTVNAVTTPPTVCEGSISAFVNGRENIGAGNTSEKWLVSSQVTVPANGQLLFSTRSTINGFDNTLYQIRVSTVSQTSGFSIVAQWTEAELNAIFNICEEKTVDLVAAGYAEGQQIYIAFVMLVTQPTTTPTGDRWIVDDVRLIERCLDPTDLSATTTSNSATLTWLGSAASWEIEVVALPAAPTGTGVPHSGSNTFLATGLSPNTSYAYYVKAICEDGTSEWVGPFNFTTTIAPVGCGGNFVDPGGPTGNYTNNLNVNTLICPENATDLVTVTFTAFATEGCCDFLRVYDGNSAAAPLIGTYSGNALPPSVTSSTPGGCLFFNFTSDGSVVGAGWIANITCAPAPSCPRPTALVTSAVLSGSVNLAWTNNSTATAWQVLALPCGSPLPNDSTTGWVDAPTNPFNVTGLNPDTCYSFYVRAICAADDSSPWSAGLNATTQQIPPACGGTFTDPGGASANYANNTNVTTTICPTNATDLVTVSFLSFATEGCCDFLRVYDGNSAAAPLIGTYAGTAIPPDITSSTPGGCLTFVFTSDGSVTAAGWVANVICGPAPTCPRPTALVTSAVLSGSVNLAWTNNSTATAWQVLALPCGSPAPNESNTGWVDAPTNPFNVTGLNPDTCYTFYVRAICAVDDISTWSAGINATTQQVPPACGGTFTDPGGATGNYANNTNVTTTICPTNATDLVTVSFLSFGTEACCDFLRIYDGNSAAAPLIGTYGGNAIPPDVTSSTPGGCLTFVFTSDGSVVGPGWVANVICGPAPTCPRPTALVTSAVLSGSVNLAWTNNSTATAWQVLALPCGSPLPNESTTGWVDAPTNPFNVTGLNPDTCYTFYVRAVCAVDDISTWSQGVNATTQQIPPACGGTFSDPGGVSANYPNNANVTTTICPTNENQVVTVTFSSFNIENNFDFLRVYDGSDATAPLIATYTGVNLPPQISSSTFGGCLTFVFTSDGVVNAPGWVASVVCTSCPSPTNLTVTATNTFTADLTWNSLSGNSWEILALPCGSPAPDANSTGWQTSTTTSHVYTGLNPLTCYTFYVRAVCDQETGPWSVSATGTTLPTCPQPIDLLATTEIGSFSVELLWTPLGPETQWEVIVQPLGTGAPGVGATGVIVNNNPSYIFIASEDVFYEYYVRAICSSTDVSFWSGPEQFSIFIPPGCASVDVVGVGVDIVDGSIVVCPDSDIEEINLSASFYGIAATTSYEVNPIEYAPPFPFTGGIQTSVNTDDVWSNAINLPFNFCFFGQSFTQAKVGSNGVVQFGNGMTNGGFCPWSYTQSVPDPNFPILNAIYGVYQDIDPNINNAFASPNINYQVLGTSPCRALVVNFSQVAQFGCTTDANIGAQTTQIVIYEISNIIEVYVQRRVPCTSWNGGRGVIGIQNATGTLGYTPPGRNTGTWTAIEEAWRFLPNGESDVDFQWLMNGSLYSDQNDISIVLTPEQQQELEENLSLTLEMQAIATYSTCTPGEEITTSKTVDIVYIIEFPSNDPVDLESCSATGTAIFDLTQNTPIILGTFDPDLFLITYYTSEEDALVPQNPIENPAEFEGTDGQQIWVRVSDLTNTCSLVKSFFLNFGDDIITPIVEFEYNPAVICVSSSSGLLLPTLAEGFNAGGEFTSTAGLVIDATTGEINLGTSTAGIYEVIYTLEAEGCTDGGTYSFTIELVNAVTPITEFSYDQEEYCKSGSNPVLEPAENFDTTGQFTATPEGLTIDPSTGAIDLSTSTDGVYEITYLVSSNTGVCEINESHTVTITINDVVDPVFETITLTYCIGATPDELPTATNGIIGTWNPSTIDTSVAVVDAEYVFTPDEGQCSNPVTWLVTVTEEVTPTFEPIVTAYCLNATPDALPVITNGITGEWSPATIDTSVAVDAVYVFTPDAGQCAVPVTILVTVSSEILPTFDPIVVCQNADAPVLPATSLEGVTGTWNGVVDTSVAGEFVFTFTPNETFECAIATTLTVVVNPTVVATFDAITTTYCQGATPDALPVSNNAVPGTWSP